MVKVSVKQSYYEKYKMYDEEKAIQHLKDEGEYIGLVYENIQLLSIKKYVENVNKKATDGNKIKENITKNVSKEELEEIKFIYNPVYGDSETVQSVRKDIKKHMKINFNFIKNELELDIDKTNLSNYKDINIDKLVSRNKFDENYDDVETKKAITGYLISISNNDEIVGLDIIDIIGVLHDAKTRTDAIKFSDKVFEWQKMVDEMIRELKIKYDRNTRFLEERIDEPHLKVVKNHLPVLHVYMEEEIERFNHMNRTIDSKPFCFVPMRPMEDIVGKSLSSLQTSYRLLCLIGYIELIQYDRITEQQSTAINKNNAYNNVSLIHIPDFYQIEDELKENYKKYDESGLILRHLSQKGMDKYLPEMKWKIFIKDVKKGSRKYV